LGFDVDGGVDVGCLYIVIVVVDGDWLFCCIVVEGFGGILGGLLYMIGSRSVLRASVKSLRSCCFRIRFRLDLFIGVVDVCASVLVEILVIQTSSVTEVGIDTSLSGDTLGVKEGCTSVLVEVLAMQTFG
jgi:hypothetical protein